ARGPARDHRLHPSTAVLTEHAGRGARQKGPGSIATARTGGRRLAAMTIAWRELPRASRRAALVGLIAFVACAIGGVLQPQTFFASWLMTWLFVVAIAVGGMM